MNSRPTGMLVNTLEQQAYAAIQRVTVNPLVVKPRLSDLANPNSDQWSAQERNYIWKSHVDFLLCDGTLPQLPPIVAIEVDGPSHLDELQARRDIMKSSILARAGVPLWRFSAKDVDGLSLPGWIAHVVALSDFDRRIGDGGFGHPPVWRELEAVKNCRLLENQERLAIEVAKQGRWVCGASECHEDWTWALVAVTVGTKSCVGGARIDVRHLPVTDRMLRVLTAELAQYDALKELGVWHQQVAADGFAMAA